MSQETVYTVTEITRELKQLLRNSYGTLWIQGELSGYKKHTSGHHYFTLKDSGAQIPCAMWHMSASRLSFSPQDGMKVLAWGNLDIYEASGRYQFIVTVLKQAGIGELQLAFEALKKKLQAEGLFDSSRKRPLPPYPKRVGLVTSPTGAALQDMLTIAARRWPAAELLLYPARVQGVGAAEEIASGIASFNRKNKVDIIVIGRGGGSMEDLWPFNEELVARAIYHSEIPLVSAVGHEVDFTISDLVADLRAPTPSVAMELILPDREDVKRDILQLKQRLNGKILGDIRYFQSRLKSLRGHWALREPVNTLNGATQRLDDLQSRLLDISTQKVNESSAALARVRELLTLFRPQAILARGYAIVQDQAGAIVRDSATLTPGLPLSITLAKGSAEAQVISTKS
jgi:exodeoxyribonuclease VII large subunit